MSNRTWILCGLGLLATMPALAVSSDATPAAAGVAPSVLPVASAPTAAAAPRVPAARALEDAFRDSDYTKLGKLIASYKSARAETKNIDKAHADLKKELDLLEKRIKRDPLSLPEDMGKALWFSNEYDKTKGLRKGKVDFIKETAYFDEKAKFGYALWLPQKYEMKNGPYPLILCIPDANEDPLTHITEKWVDSTIRENAIIAAVTMPADTKVWLDTGVPGREGGGGNMLFTLSQILRNYAVDFDRIYLAGRGLGVEAAVTLAARYPDRFAGVIGRSGDAPAEVAAENMMNLPLFFAAAGGNATKLEEKLKALGYDTLQRKDDAGEADIWAWMQAHPRQPNPVSVALYPTNQTTHSFWLEWVPNDAQGEVYVKATLDRTANTITVEGEGVTEFQIYFNDSMLDLDKPVKVIANSAEVSRVVTRSLPRALDFLFNARSDPGRFYVNNMRFDLPPKPKPPADKPGEKSGQKPGEKSGEKSGEQPGEESGQE